MKQIRFAVYMKVFVVDDTENGLAKDLSNAEELRKNIEDHWSVEDVVESSAVTDWDVHSVIEEVTYCIEDK